MMDNFKVIIVEDVPLELKVRKEFSKTIYLKLRLSEQLTVR